jgi:ankyrin repeat protein
MPATGVFAAKATASLQILKFLLGKGMDIESPHRISEENCEIFPATPLWYAYTRGRNEKLYSHLLKHGADPRRCMYAITWYDDTPAATLFKKYGAFCRERGSHKPARSKGKSKNSYFEDINGTPGEDSPLLAAYAWKKWNMAEWLLKNGADPDSTDKRGATPLFHAVRKKYEPAQIKLLLKHGADPDHASNDGRTPRTLAASYRDKTILQLLQRVEH